ncbi:MAG: diaminopimelate decarboxylase [Armatimonadetes bacterium]|nr:diaminopimelate decarboxylase [Armatimonadota bacterium]
MISPETVDSRFKLDEKQAESLAQQFGTPLYVIDEAHFRHRIRRYIAAFQAAWPHSELTYASKANSTLGVLAIAASEGCLIDAASEGEFRAALAAGVPAGRCHLHGNNKSQKELAFAFENGIGQIVLDNFGEIELVADLAKSNPCPELVLRLAPGVDPVTHAKISTGQADTKFGFNLTDGAAEKALVRCLELGLPVVGFHCHVGSQLLDPEAQISGGELLAEFAARMLREHQFETRILNVGGGLGVHYTDSDNPMDVESYCQNLCAAIEQALQGTGLAPKLTQEPGRSLIAESGVTLYQVGVRKTVPSQKFGTRTYLAVDGGLSDNPRPVMYGSKYTVVPIRPSTEENQAFTISGKHCETDMLFEQVPLPADISEGDLVQVLCTGAYNSSMASNYNRYPRPCTALIRSSGEFALLQRQDTWDEMFTRESVPAGLQ